MDGFTCDSIMLHSAPGSDAVDAIKGQFAEMGSAIGQLGSHIAEKLEGLCAMLSDTFGGQKYNVAEADHDFKVANVAAGMERSSETMRS